MASLVTVNFRNSAKGLFVQPGNRPRTFSESRIFRGIEEIFAGLVLVPGRHRPMWLAFVRFVESEFELHTARVIDEKLP